MKMHRPGSTYPYILEADRDSESPTVFNLLHHLTWQDMQDVNAEPAMSLSASIQVLAIRQIAKEENRELTVEESQRINEIAPMDNAMSARLNNQHAKACQYGIASIDNLVDADSGAALEVSVEDFIKHAPVYVLREIGQQIIRGNELKGDAAKK